MRVELAAAGVRLVIVNPGDAPAHTPLTAGQAPHYRAMEAAMTEWEVRLHGGLLRRARDYYTAPFPGAGPPLARLAVPGYYATMEEALGSPAPRPYYCNSAPATAAVFTLIKLLPRQISDGLRRRMMKCYDQ